MIYRTVWKVQNLPEATVLDNGESWIRSQELLHHSPLYHKLDNLLPNYTNYSPRHNSLADLPLEPG